MTNPVFPTAIGPLQDSKFYTVEMEDVGMKTKMDGGYVVSRARHTRKARRTYTTGFTDLTGTQVLLLTDFYDLVKGSSVVFDWVDPLGGLTIPVRFTDPLNLKYTGIGPTKRYDVQFKLEEA